MKSIKKLLFSFLFCAMTPLTQGNTPKDKTVNPIANISHDPGYCCIIHSWGFIGDSLASGEHESKDEKGKKGYHDYYDYSWGQRICAATGTKGDNYSQGGETAKGWIDHFWNNPRNRNNNIDAKASPKQAYIIALGVNEGNQKFPVGNTDTDIDQNDYNRNANTFAGNYAGIIQRVRSIAPDSRIFVVTDPGRFVKKESVYNPVIRKMAEIFPHVYVLDIHRFGPDYIRGSEFHKKFFLGGHMNAMGYQYTAWMFMTYINHIIENNWEDFCQVGFFNTGLKN